jgi:adenosylmethionine---8-amino-7-oxononanoate aminotransferase
MNLPKRSHRAVWHPCSQMQWHEIQGVLPIARAQGAWLYDTNERPYLDAISSWWVNLFGHGHPHIKAALHAQLEQLCHVMLAGCTHEPVVALSEKLAQLTGLGHASYASDGASAVEIALKMSAHYWHNMGQPDKCQFVGLANGYHGETVGALSVTDMAIFRRAYGPLLRVSAVVPSPDARLAAPGVSALERAQVCAQALEEYLAQHHAHTAALVIEPLVQCAAGMAMHHPHYVQQAHLLCKRYQVHLVLDEIAVGFGRTGSMFAHQQSHIRPDFLCLSKGLTGGTMALSAVLTTEAIYQAFYDHRPERAFLHSHSYTGNPLACRAALATLEIFEQQDWLTRNRCTAEHLNVLLAPLAQHPQVRHARHLGMVWAFDIDTPKPGFARRYHQAALAHQLMLRPIGNTLYFMPPYVLTEPDCQHLVDGALAALNEVV